jgi:hypothetical protein
LKGELKVSGNAATKASLPIEVNRIEKWSVVYQGRLVPSAKSIHVDLSASGWAWLHSVSLSIFRVGHTRGMPAGGVQRRIIVEIAQRRAEGDLRAGAEARDVSSRGWWHPRPGIFSGPSAFRDNKGLSERSKVIADSRTITVA